MADCCAKWFFSFIEIIVHQFTWCSVNSVNFFYFHDHYFLFILAYYYF